MALCFFHSLKAFCSIQLCSLVAKSRGFAGARIRSWRARYSSSLSARNFAICNGFWKFSYFSSSLFLVLPLLFSFLPQQPAANEYKVAAVVWNFLKLPSSGELPPCCRIQRGKMSVLPVTHCFIVFPRIALRSFDGARGNKRRFSWSFFDYSSFFAYKGSGNFQKLSGKLLRYYSELSHFRLQKWYIYILHWCS